MGRAFLSQLLLLTLPYVALTKIPKTESPQMKIPIEILPPTTNHDENESESVFLLANTTVYNWDDT
jgi:hypothetical protein